MGANPLCHGNEISDLIKQEKGESYYNGWNAALDEAIRIAHAGKLPYLVRDIERLKEQIAEKK